MTKDIIGYEGLYIIDEKGNIYNKNTGKKKSPHLDSKGRYYIVDLYKNNVRKKWLIHRLIAIHFCEGYNENYIVDHIDNNTHNNHYSNLQWISQKENIHKSYDTMDQVRNYVNCNLYKGETFIKSFKSIEECCRYCKEELNLSHSTMAKYRKAKGYYIINV